MINIATSYSSKAAAKLGAKRKAAKDASFDSTKISFIQQEDGRWVWVSFDNVEKSEVSPPKEVQDLPTVEPETEVLPVRKFKMHLVERTVQIEREPTVAVILPGIAARLVIEKNRQVSENVTRRSKGTRSEVIWAMCDAMLEKGLKITPKTVHDELCANGTPINTTTTSKAMYLWKKFNNV